MGILTWEPNEIRLAPIRGYGQLDIREIKNEKIEPGKMGKLQV